MHSVYSVLEAVAVLYMTTEVMGLPGREKREKRAELSKVKVEAEMDTVQLYIMRTNKTLCHYLRAYRRLLARSNGRHWAGASQPLAHDGRAGLVHGSVSERWMLMLVLMPMMIYRIPVCEYGPPRGKKRAK